jgi:hypothetical protein
MESFELVRRRGPRRFRQKWCAMGEDNRSPTLRPRSAAGQTGIVPPRHARKRRRPGACAAG